MSNVLFVFFVCFVVVCSGYRTGQLKCNKPNEEVRCVKDCPPEKTCRNRNIQVRCADDKKKCTPKCVCQEGYFRNVIGNCITGAQCDQCCRPNEFYDCGTACDNECEKLDRQNRTNCPIKNVMCNKMCYCEDGYGRDPKKNCVPVDKCPKKPDPCKNKKCGPNEVCACKMTCPPDSCEAFVAKFKCDSKATCVHDCYCKDGFWRKDNKIVNGKKSPCIPKCQCLQMKYTKGCRKPTIWAN